MCNYRKASVLGLALALTTAACFPGARGRTLSASLGPAPTHLERLYFGRNIADTAVVSDSAFGTFVRDVLTPKFPEGATVYDASGQWRAPNGTLVREPSYVVELLHPATPESEALVQGVIDAYKTRFAQQAVLRLVSSVQATF